MRSSEHLMFNLLLFLFVVSKEEKEKKGRRENFMTRLVVAAV